jgi:hypothetical protein
MEEEDTTSLETTVTISRQAVIFQIGLLESSAAPPQILNSQAIYGRMKKELPTTTPRSFQNR